MLRTASLNAIIIPDTKMVMIPKALNKFKYSPQIIIPQKTERTKEEYSNGETNPATPQL